jgi:hypothetical protein
METIATLLQRERLLLELLVFKITELRHLLAAGDPRFLGWASEEVERAVDAVRHVELERALLLRDATGDPDLDESVALSQLAEAAPEPWGTVLTEHRLALVALASQVTNGLEAARRLADVGSSAVNDLLDRVDGAVTETPLLTYGPDSSTARAASSPRVRATL